MPAGDAPLSNFPAIATLQSADLFAMLDSSESEASTATGTVVLAWLGASLDMSTIASGGALPVARGGTGRATGTTAYCLVATGTTATGAQQTLANGAATEILVGGGASALPVWTTATGSGSPVRATSPTLVTPVLGVASATSLACPTFTTAAAAMNFTPNAGQGFNVNLSGAGDFIINTNQIWLDTSTGIWTQRPAADGAGVFQILSNGGSLKYRIDTTGGDVSVWLRNSANTYTVFVTANGVTYFNGGNVVIGNTTGNSNAILDVQSTTKAFMPPRMTTAQKNAITSPTAGMVVYDTTLNKLCVYTTAWETVTSA